MPVQARHLLWLVSVAAVLALLGATAVAWTIWPPFLRYRLGRAHAQMVGVVEAYLVGQESFDYAAHRLATLSTESQTLAARLPRPSPNEGRLSIEYQGIAPSGYADNDPRIDSLARRAFVLSLPVEERPRIEELMHARR